MSKAVGGKVKTAAEDIKTLVETSGERSLNSPRLAIWETCGQLLLDLVDAGAFDEGEKNKKYRAHARQQQLMSDSEGLSRKIGAWDSAIAIFAGADQERTTGEFIPIWIEHFEGVVVHLQTLADELNGAKKKAVRTTHKKRGRKPRRNHGADKKLVLDWEAAKRSGSSRGEFCSQLSISVKYLEQAQQSVRRGDSA